MKRFQTVEEAPEWARNDLQTLIDVGWLRGRDGQGGQLDLTEDMIRTMIIIARALDVLR